MTLLLAGLTLIFAGAVASVVLRARTTGDGVFRLAVIAGCFLCGVSAVRVVLGVAPMRAFPAARGFLDWMR
jgi:hypothetical protein